MSYLHMLSLSILVQSSITLISCRSIEKKIDSTTFGTESMATIAFGKPLRSALPELCLSIVCNEACRMDHVLFAAAESRCANSLAEVKLTCGTAASPSWKMATTLNDLNSLTGSFNGDKAVCKYLETVVQVDSSISEDIYRCDLGQGRDTFTGSFATHVTKVKSDGTFKGKLSFWADEDQPDGSESCRGLIDIHSL